METEQKTYKLLPTIQRFHESSATIRCIVGPVGSGKTTAAAFEVCWYIPRQLFDRYGIRQTRWVIVRNTYSELRDTTQRTVFDWFPHGREQKQANIYTIQWPYKGATLEVELLFRSCDRPDDVKKFKSLEITGYWVDESIEVADEIKRMLKNRIGRFPAKSPKKYGIETTNPPEVEMPTYHQFAWDTPPPGPLPTTKPLEDHAGFWQPPRENEENLPDGYYDDLLKFYADNPDWADTYVEGKPGIIVQGKLVYKNFKRDYHVAKESLIWCRDVIFRGWDNSGNCPACIAVQLPTAGQAQVIKEWHTEREGIVDFTWRVVEDSNRLWPNAEYVDWADPAGFNQFSKKIGGFTSNAELMASEEAGAVEVEASEQNFTARRESVDQLMGRIDGLLIDPGCIRLINGFLGGYHYKEIGGPGTGIYSTEPVKNKFSHPHDALQYVIVRLFRARKPGSGDEEEDRRFVDDQRRRQPDEDTGY